MTQQQLIFIASNYDPEINQKIIELSSHGFEVNNGTLLEQSILLIPKASFFILLTKCLTDKSFIEFGIACCNNTAIKICIIDQIHTKFYALPGLYFYANWDNFIAREFFS